MGVIDLILDFVLVALCVVYYYKLLRAQKELKEWRKGGKLFRHYVFMTEDEAQRDRLTEDSIKWRLAKRLASRIVHYNEPKKCTFKGKSVYMYDLELREKEK